MLENEQNVLVSHSGPIATWVAELAKKSVFIDGLSHDLFYLIAATKPKERGYDAIAVGKFHDDSFKIKFYGGFTTWGLNRQVLRDYYFAKSFLSRMNKGGPGDEDDEGGEDAYVCDYAGYERYFTNLNGLCLLIQSFQGNERGVTVASTRDILKAFDISQEQREEMATKFQFYSIGKGMPGLPKLDKAALD